MAGLYNSISVSEAAALQKEMRNKLILETLENFMVHTIGGADISFNKYETTVYAGIIVLSFPDLHPVAYSLVKTEVTFPYVSGYLAFREAPALIEAWEQLPQKPDVLVVDGHGIAHPRRMGIASHFGVLTGQPTIGCAKKILFGKYEPPLDVRGAYSYIHDKEDVLGAVLRTREKVKPVFVSPGYKLNLQDSINIILQCMGKYRIPEPTRRAHELVNAFRRGELQEGYIKL
ncbi:deoxyribonuclease V [Flavisolibacter tropicus]|uniref:Endonuclease V n=1 Tax=Flavisolibacter tropicus TaxID=1492898 RepID=A0A172U059_9BACT|nr:deoxyribonuclease V [Flavisolibacter tropicus]ANE52504.1 endonuclease V [Flavisolibacter tropicus]